MKMIINPDLSLNEIKESLRAALKEASEDSRHGLRFFSVATVNPENNTPESRMVVLRDFLPEWTLRFYTDFRSSKVAQIQNHPAISLLFWNMNERYQVRIEAESTIHYKDNISKSEWENVTGEAQKAYTSVLPPGKIISHPEEAGDRITQKNYFCVIDAKATRIKILQLKSTEQWAVKFLRDSDTDEWIGHWIVP